MDKKVHIPKCVKELKEHTVFKFKDEEAGDWKGLLCFVSNIKPARPPYGNSGTMYQIITEDGYCDWQHERELVDINPKTIRPYNSEKDPDFYFYLG